VHVPTPTNRQPFFRTLSQLYDLTIYYTDTFSAEGLEGIKYEMFRRYPRDRPSMSKYPGDIQVPGLIPRLVFGDHDVVVGSLFDFVSFFVTKIRRKPFILWSETWHFSERESVAFRLVSPFFRFVIRHSDAVLVPSQMHKAETISLGARATKTFIMPNVSSMYVISSDYGKAEELRSRFALKGKRIILYVGRLDEQKGVQYLIAAFAKLAAERNEISLVCVGDGPFKTELELLCERLDVVDRVRFVGWIDVEIARNKNIVPYYLLCDVCVVPSIFLRGRPDACPLVVNEAMACGKAVVATTAVGAAYAMIKNGINGFVVPEKDSAALCNAIKAVLADPATAKAMGEASKKVVEAGFTYSHMVSGFQSAISSLNVAD
jgi:glycosyltransferase involved in cell wall biosynthesis